MLDAGSDGYKSVPAALSAMAPHSAENTFSVLPQHLQRIVLHTSVEQRGCLHMMAPLPNRRCRGLRRTPLRRLAARENGAKTPDQIGLLQRLTKVALNPQGQHALPRSIVGIGGDEYRWDRAS